MIHAFLIIFHNNFSQLKELIHFLDDKDFLLVLGIDEKVNTPSIKQEITFCIQKSMYKYLELKVFWGGVSQIKSTLKRCRIACRYDIDYIHFLTGVDVPLMTKRKMKEFFDEKSGLEFVEYAPENYSFAYFKCNYYHFFIENQYYRTSIILKLLNHVSVRMQKMIGLTRKRSHLYHGSAYFSITIKLMNYLLEQEEKIINRYKYTLGADEVWLQTELKSSPFCKSIYNFENSDANLRYIDWEHREGSSPHTFTIEDEERLLKVINTKYLFARKFDENKDKEIIVKIYRYLEKNK